MSSFVKASGGITPNSADPGEEFPFLHTITVVDRVVRVDKPELVQNNIKTETVTLNLDSEWEGLSTVINIGNKKPVSVIWSGEPVVIPAELMTTVGSLDVSVVGYGDDGGIRAVTKKATSIFNVVASGFVEGDEAVPDPTTILGQLTEAADRANRAADRFNQASEDIGDISDAVTEVEGYAGSAKTSETNAASSATAASRSETNAASSASAAKISETNAAASATAAQNAVDGFGLEVGTTTTGEPGTDAEVAIQKNGTKYTANFTIPRGDVGPAGVNENVPLGSTSGVVAQGTDSYPTLPRKVQVHGRTIENLWVTYNQSTNNGVILDTDDTGLITVTGNATTNTEVTFYSTIEANPGDTFTVKASVDTNNTNGKLKIQCAKQNGSYFAIDVSTSPKTFSIPEGNSGLALYIRIPYDESLHSGLRYQFYVTLVRGSEAPVAFTPSGVHTVEPTKLIVAGKNLASVTTNSNNPNLLISDVLPPGDYVFSAAGEVIEQGYNLRVDSLSGYNIVSNARGQTTKFSLDRYASVFLNMHNIGGVENIQIEKGASATRFEQPVRSEVNLPSDISLADGDTLAIDRDGTTRILHAEGEPTVLENVTLPELPAPTFNVYTTGGYVPPTVDVGYEQDVNLALDREIPHDATLVGNGTKSSPLGVGDLLSRYTPTTTTTALDTRVKALESKPSGLASVTHDETLTGDGTSGSPLGLVDGNIINPINTDDADSVDPNKLYIVASNTANIPSVGIRGNLYYSRVGAAYFQIIFGYSDLSSGPVIYMRKSWSNLTSSQWVRFINERDLSNYVPLATYQALEARVQALEAKLSNQ